MAYANIKGFKALEHIDFDFENAHDEYPLTSSASDESDTGRLLVPH